MARLYKDDNRECDLKCGELGVIIHSDQKEYLGCIVVKVSDSGLYQILGREESYFSDELVKIRKLTKGELIEV